jgi:hypothetical protein
MPKTIEKLLRAVFSVGSAPGLSKKDPRPAERIIERQSMVGSRELSPAREAENRWSYS